MTTDQVTDTSSKQRVFILWFFAGVIGLIYFQQSGFGPLDFILNLVFAVFFSGVVGFGVWLFATMPVWLMGFSRSDKGKAKFASRSGSIALAIGVGLFLASCVGNILTAPLARAFYARVEKGSTGSQNIVAETGGHNGGPIVADDYGGDLDTIVHQRDHLLSTSGFLHLGSWKAGSMGPSVISYNLYLGPFAPHRD